MEWRRIRRAAHLKRWDIMFLKDCQDQRAHTLANDLTKELDELETKMGILHQEVLTLSSCVIEFDPFSKSGYKPVKIFDSSHTYRTAELARLERKRSLTTHDQLVRTLLEMEEQEYMDTYEATKARRAVEERDYEERKEYVRKRRMKKSKYNPAHESNPLHQMWAENKDQKEE